MNAPLSLFMGRRAIKAIQRVWTYSKKLGFTVLSAKNKLCLTYKMCLLTSENGIVYRRIHTIHLVKLLKWWMNISIFLIVQMLFTFVFLSDFTPSKRQKTDTNDNNEIERYPWAAFVSKSPAKSPKGCSSRVPIPAGPSVLNSIRGDVVKDISNGAYCTYARMYFCAWFCPF